jgi:2-oxoglutarate/2-oxoacid ferredoxin oxidoreductase subunit alpha
VIVPEMNMGQLSKLLRAEFLIPTISINQVKGLPFRAGDLEARIEEHLDE